MGEDMNLNDKSILHSRVLTDDALDKKLTT